MKQFVKKRVEEISYEPRDWMGVILLFPVLSAFAFFWMYSIAWLSGMTMDSAKWTLSTQSQATAAILGLLIVAVIFRWTRVVEQESQLRGFMHHYIREIARHPLGAADSTSLTVVLAYEEYYNLIAVMKKRKELPKVALISLGHMWVLKEISQYYRSSNLPPHDLKRGQIKQLSEIGAVSSDSAATMWEHYFSRPSEFILEMFETLTQVNSTTLSVEKSGGHSSSGENDIKTFADKYGPLEIYRQEMFDKAPEWKLEAERLVRIRKGTLGPFYAVCSILFLAVLTGFLGIIGIDNAKSAEAVTLSWLVGLPTGLSALGLLMSLVIVVRIIR